MTAHQYLESLGLPLDDCKQITKTIHEALFEKFFSSLGGEKVAVETAMDKILERVPVIKDNPRALMAVGMLIQWAVSNLRD
jgi:hypothetical protein